MKVKASNTAIFFLASVALLLLAWFVVTTNRALRTQVQASSYPTNGW